ncbi:MAG: hypothetical protein R3277_07670 [Brumimicrobium sp.]|nr:hypothetical protein [Brumimicrobium sp.]
MDGKHLLIAGLILTTVIFSSCRSKSHEPESVKLEDILPQAKRTYDFEEDSLKKPEVEKPDSVVLAVLTSFPEMEVIQTNEETVNSNNFFPDRLNYLTRSKAFFKSPNGIFRVNMWEFKDSLQTISAFFNWLDRFGPRNKSVRVGEEIALQKQGFYLLTDNSRIIYIESESKIDTERWTNLFDSEKKDTWNYRLIQQTGKKVKWIDLRVEQPVTAPE